MTTALQRAYDGIRTGEAMFRDAARFRQIATVLARHGFGAFLQRLSLRDEWLVRKILEFRSTEVEQSPLEQRLVTAIQELGPTFVKLGQILSTRADLLPPALVSELETLQDDVAPMTEADVRSVIHAQLGSDPDDLFAAFDPQPLASASIAQVHRARLSDGTEVAVKVQRPNIAKQIDADLEIMLFLADRLEANFPDARLYSPSGMVHEFEKAIRRELDFTHEIDHIERFRRNFHDNPDVHFPLPYRQYSGARVLTMEFIRGTKITRITTDHFDPDKVVRTTLNSVLQMIHVDGFFHGDLHPGNILVQDDNTVCFIDFGLCGHLAARQRDRLVDLLISVVRQDFPAAARTFWKIGIHNKDSTRDYETFEGDVVQALEYRFADKKVEDIEFSALFRDLVELALKHRIRMPSDYTMTFKAVITAEGVAKQLVPDMDLTAAVRPYVTTLLAERYNPRRLAQTAYEAFRDLSDTLGSLPDTSRAILEDLRAGRTQLNLELTQWRELRDTYGRIQHRNMLAMMAAACAVCGTLALDFQDYSLFGFPALSFCFYAIAAGLAVRYFIAAGPSGRP